MEYKNIDYLKPFSIIQNTTEFSVQGNNFPIGEKFTYVKCDANMASSEYCGHYSISDYSCNVFYSHSLKKYIEVRHLDMIFKKNSGFLFKKIGYNYEFKKEYYSIPNLIKRFIENGCLNIIIMTAISVFLLYKFCLLLERYNVFG